MREMEVWVLHGSKPGTIEVAFCDESNPIAYMREMRENGLTNEEAELIAQRIVQNLRTVGVNAQYEILSDGRLLIHTDNAEFGYMHLSYYIEMWLPNLVGKFGY